MAITPTIRQWKNIYIIWCNFRPVTACGYKCSFAAWMVWLEMLTEVGGTNFRQKPPGLRDNGTTGAMTPAPLWYRSHGSWGRTWVYIVGSLTDGETLSWDHFRIYILVTTQTKWNETFETVTFLGMALLKPLALLANIYQW